jgi:hypothetical protein
LPIILKFFFTADISIFCIMSDFEFAKIRIYDNLSVILK